MARRYTFNDPALDEAWAELEEAIGKTEGRVVQAMERLKNVLHASEAQFLPDDLEGDTP